MKSTKYRAALIGCGHRGGIHATAFNSDPRLEMAALVDIIPEKAQALKEKYNLNSEIYTDYHKMLEEVKPDIVLICLWTNMHVPVLRDCAEAGVKIIHSEKPMGGTWSAYCEAAKIAADYSLQLTYDHQRRFAPGNIAVRKLIDEGRFGKIKRMDLFSPTHLLDCGTHTFDQASSFNGESPVKWVMGSADLSRTVKYFEVPAECAFTGFLQYENGVDATIRVGLNNMSIWGGVRVIGEDGFIEVMWDGDVPNAVVYSDPTWKFTPVANNNHMEGVIRDILDSADNGTVSEIDYTKALRAGETIYSFYESAITNRRIELPFNGGAAPDKYPIDRF